MVRVAVVGVGRMGRHHARNYTELPGVDLVAVADPDPGSADLARRYRCRHYTTVDALLRSERLDAVSVCVPTRLHPEVAIACLEAGAHTLVEKPIAATLAGASAILDAAARTGRVLMVGHVERFNPAVRALKRLIAEGGLGTLLMLHSQRLGVLPGRAPDANVIVDIGVHDLDLANYLVGTTPDTLVANGGRSLCADCEDFASIFLRYGPVTATIQVSWVTPLKLRRLVACGTEGYVELNLVTQDLRFYDRPHGQDYGSFHEFVIRYGDGPGAGLALPVPQRGCEPLRVELEEFLAAARFGWTPPVAGEDALAALRLALDATEQVRERLACLS